jgi:hypothetical protein
MRCSIRPKGPARRKSLKKEVNYIYGGPELYESRRKQNLTAQDVMAVSPTTPKYLK